MTRLHHTGFRRRTLALMGATVIALVVVAGPPAVMAVKSLPATPGTSDGAGALGGDLVAQTGAEPAPTGLSKSLLLIGGRPQGTVRAGWLIGSRWRR